jgi:hypothetical protein
VDRYSFTVQLLHLLHHASMMLPTAFQTLRVWYYMQAAFGIWLALRHVTHRMVAAQ